MRNHGSYTSDVVLTQRALWVAVVIKTLQLRKLKYKPYYLYLSNSSKPDNNLNENVFNFSPTHKRRLMGGGCHSSKKLVGSWEGLYGRWEGLKGF